MLAKSGNRGGPFRILGGTKSRTQLVQRAFTTNIAAVLYMTSVIQSIFVSQFRHRRLALASHPFPCCGLKLLYGAQMKLPVCV